MRIYIDILNRRFFLSLFCLLLIVCPLSCGKKGDPTLKSYEKPPAPSELKAIHRESEIILSWNFPKGKEQPLKGFHLMRSSDGDFEKLAFIENDKRSYIDKNFLMEHAYRYKILSESLKGVTSIDSNIMEIKPKYEPPAPQNVSFSIEHDSVILKWTSAGKGILYNVYKADIRGDYPIIPLNKEPLRDTNIKDTFSVKKPVYYTIRSLLGGNVRDEGPASAEITADPSELVPPAPEDLQAVVTKENIYLIWKAPPEIWITRYRVYREIEKEGGYTLIGESQIPSFIDKDPPLTKRNYKVTALGPSKEGPPADIRDVVYNKPR